MYVVRTQPIFQKKKTIEYFMGNVCSYNSANFSKKKKITEGNPRKLAVSFTDLVSLRSRKSEKKTHAIQALFAILVPSMRALLKL